MDKIIKERPKDYIINLHKIVNGKDGIQTMDVAEIATLICATDEQKKQAEIETSKGDTSTPFTKYVDELITQYGIEK